MVLAMKGNLEVSGHVSGYLEEGSAIHKTFEGMELFTAGIVPEYAELV